MKTKSLLIASTLILSTLIFSACRPNGPAATVEVTPSPITDTTTSPQPPAQDGKLKANYEFTATDSGQLALDLIDATEEIKTTDYGAAGKFITSINGLEGNNEYYWAFYLNGNYAEQGASQTKLQKGDIIKFVYEAVALNK